MDNRNILDAPENQTTRPRIPLKLVLITTACFSLAFFIILFVTYSLDFSLFDFRWAFFTINANVLIYPLIISFGLYFFNSFLNAEFNQMPRVITTSVSMLFVGLVAGYFLFVLAHQFFSEDSIHFSHFLAIKHSVFIALAGGIGISLAVRFLLKKQYLVFSAIMISTIAVFSLIEYL